MTLVGGRRPCERSQTRKTSRVEDTPPETVRKDRGVRGRCEGTRRVNWVCSETVSLTTRETVTTGCVDRGRPSPDKKFKELPPKRPDPVDTSRPTRDTGGNPKTPESPVPHLTTLLILENRKYTSWVRTSAPPSSKVVVLSRPELHVRAKLGDEHNVNDNRVTGLFSVPIPI